MKFDFLKSQLLLDIPIDLTSSRSKLGVIFDWFDPESILDLWWISWSFYTQLKIKDQKSTITYKDKQTKQKHIYTYISYLKHEYMYIHTTHDSQTHIGIDDR